MNNKINLIINKALIDNFLDLTDNTSTKELSGVVLCNADIENNTLSINAKRFIELKNISLIPEIQIIPEIDERVYRIIMEYDTTCFVHTHIYCRDPSLGDFSKFTNSKFIYREGPQPPLVITTPDIVITKCFIAFVLLFPFSVIIDIKGMRFETYSKKFEVQFIPRLEDDVMIIEFMNRDTQVAILSLMELKDIYERYHFKWRWKFNPEEEYLNMEKNEENIIRKLPKELIEKIRENI